MERSHLLQVQRLLRTWEWEMEVRRLKKKRRGTRERIKINEKRGEKENGGKSSGPSKENNQEQKRGENG